jgi:hypothetical protein
MPDGLPLRPDDPSELGGHRILGRLGEGNQGVVYLGLAPSGRRVAIKMLRARMAEDPGAHERFVRELSAAKKVARFCTAQVLAADFDDDRPYIVSEYVEGRSLRSHILQEGPRTGGALERLAIGTLTALAAIHRAGVVHRDFTPHNVLLGPDGPRVIDFGIARALGAVARAETNSVGTPSYMAPEQVAGREVGPPADMFAWGSTILFAATGRPPFGNDSVHAVMERIVNAEPDVSALEEPLRSVVSACLAKSPAERPTAQQAQAMLLGDEAEESMGALMPPPAFGAAPGTTTPAAPPAGAMDFHRPITPAMAAAAGTNPPGDRRPEPDAESRGTPPAQTPAAPSDVPAASGDVPATGPSAAENPTVRLAFPPAAPAPATRQPDAAEPPAPGPPAAAAPGPAVEFPFPLAVPAGEGAPRGGSVPAPASGALARTDAPGRRRVHWAVIAGAAAVVVAGVALAVPLWPDGGDAADGPKARAAAELPTTPTPTPTAVAPTTPEPQLNGVRSGLPRAPAHKPGWKCRDYQHVYTMLGIGTVVLHVSVCRDVFSGTAVLADSAPKDGWDVCVQLRGHVTKPAAYLSTLPMTSKGGRTQSFKNGPTVKFGPKTTRTEDSVAVNAGRCHGSGAHVQTSWVDQERLPAG